MSSPRIATVEIEGTAPLMFGRQVFESRLNEETHEQYEARTVLKKVTVDQDGNVAINPQAIKASLEWAGSWRNEKVPGGAGGKETFKRRFMAGVQVADPYFTVSNGKKRVKPEDLEIIRLSVPSNGQRGGKTRVVRMFPRLNPPWKATLRILIMDHAIDEAVLRRHMETAGLFDGIGSMRIRNGGPNGRYIVNRIRVEELA